MIVFNSVISVKMIFNIYLYEYIVTLSMKFICSVSDHLQVKICDE